MRQLTALVFIVLLVASTIIPSAADTVRAADYDIANGHFYTQAAAQPSPLNGHPRGYAVTNEEGIAFWSEFRRLGGVSMFGYPISRRFIWNGSVVQVMQKGVLAWNPAMRRADVVAVVDEMAQHAAGISALEARGIPPVLDGVGALSADDRFALMNGHPELKRYYMATGNALLYYGLPTSSVMDIENGWMIRTEKTVLAVWTVDQPWARKGNGVSALTGEWLRDSGVFPGDVFQTLEAPATLPAPPPVAAVPAPAPAPAPAPRPTAAPAPAPAPASGVTVVSSRTGRASWYGADFHGNVMRNGEIYNMYDPTTTAANIYPLGSWLRVTSLRTGRSVVVRVTDTGAFREPFIVDLSYAAFGLIDDHRAGWIEARIELLSGRPR